MKQEVPPLLEQDVHPDPIEQFRRWFDQALAGNFVEPTAVALATANAGRPSVRMVLLKAYDASGFVFYTNYASRKGDDLATNPHAALLWWWDKQYRQVRVEGAVEKVSRAESEAYFRTRPRGSQFSAVVSPQSRRIADRASLETQVVALERQIGDADVPLPDDWGGYRLRPEQFEFWQGRRDRLHDRICYRKHEDVWRIERLGP